MKRKKCIWKTTELFRIIIFGIDTVQRIIFNAIKQMPMLFAVWANSRILNFKKIFLIKHFWKKLVVLKQSVIY